MELPKLIELALSRTHESPDVSASWIWFFNSSAEERRAVDSWLAATKHPSAYEPGTPEYRFRNIVKEMRS